MATELNFAAYTNEEMAGWYRRVMGLELPAAGLYRDFYTSALSPYLERPYLDAGYAPLGGYVKDFSMVHDGRAWHLFHIDGRPGEPCTVDGNEISFGHASSGDLQSWVRHPCPLAVGNHGEWDSRHVWAPFVMRSPLADEWLMFYMGTSHEDPHHGRIGRAVSKDLLFWAKDGAGDLYRPGAWSRRNCRDPHVFRYGDAFAMVTTANAADGTGAVALALSKDLKHWEDQEPLRVFKGETWTPESSGVMPFRGGWLGWVSACSVEGTIPLYLMFAPTLEGLREARIVPVAGTGPRAIAMEVLHAGATEWLIACFERVQDSFGLFFGILDLCDLERPCLTTVARAGQLVAYSERAAQSRPSAGPRTTRVPER
ncbi:MAG: hypothetical protein PHR35_10730 [Kiritimatiellae bacterium]|nr:hypothetical protein [Kiritimatiellia bacterium]